MASESVIGRSVPRLDGPAKVSGLARYVSDLGMPGMLHARLVLSPHAHARILGFATSSALAMPGVVAILTASDLDLKGKGSPRAHSPLARERVVFCGQPVAVVLAEDEGVAQEAVSLVDVQYEVLPAVVDPLAALAPDAPAVRGEGAEAGEEELAMHGAEVGAGPLEEGQRSPNVASNIRWRRGDVDQGFREADVVLERTYRTSVVHQSYLEPHAVLAASDPLGNVTVWTSTQALFYVRDEVASALGLPANRVRVVPMTVGGGFGGKFLLLEPLVAFLAVRLKRPVRLIMDRMDEFLATTPAPQTVIWLKAGARRDGALTALQAHAIYDSGAYQGAPLGIGCQMLGGYYRFRNLDIQGTEVLTHKPSVGAYRAPGVPQATFAIESHMDELAHLLDMDPLELRLKNAVQEGDPMPSGSRWPGIGLRQCLEALRDHPAWQEARRLSPSAPPSASAPSARAGTGGRAGKGHNRQEVRTAVGYGLAIGGWVGGVEPSAATCLVNADGTVRVSVGAIDISGTFTTLAQVTAEVLGVPVESVQVETGDTTAVPYAGSSSGSKVTRTVGTAVLRAAEDARRQVLAIAADRLETAPQDLEIVHGTVRVRGAPERRISVGEVARLSQEFAGKYEPVFGRGASAVRTRAPGFAVHLARVEVDLDSGAVRVARYVAVQDVGRAINPAEVEGQVRGGVAQGIGWALLERMVYDQEGRLLTGSFLDYALPPADGVPPIEVVLVEVPGPDGPFGAKGVGEPPVVPGAAAIANAIRDATGIRLTDLPITSERLCAALKGW